ncbi:MAG: hypothetical protein OXC00_12480 [Acidimicrobiaceae bacterium]|nr:hypothetical protein [Acidimicrobiaceae bacterium]
MDSTLIATVVGVLGAGFLGVLGYFLQALRSDIGGLGTRLGSIETTLAEHGAMLAEYGRLLERMADQGERIAALEGRRRDT